MYTYTYIERERERERKRYSYLCLYAFKLYTYTKTKLLFSKANDITYTTTPFVLFWGEACSFWAKVKPF